MPKSKRFYIHNGKTAAAMHIAPKETAKKPKDRVHEQRQRAQLVYGSSTAPLPGIRALWFWDPTLCPQPEDASRRGCRP